MLKNSENNGMDEIRLVTPTPPPQKTYTVSHEAPSGFTVFIYDILYLHTFSSVYTLQGTI